MGIVNTVVGAIERLLVAVGTVQRLFFLVALTLLFSTIFLGYKVIESQEVLRELSSPKVERVGSFCYQQRVRRDTRIIGIQFPIPDYLIEKGVEQNLSALVIPKGSISQKEFDFYCKSLINEILDPGVELNLLRANPAWESKLKIFYQNLDKTTPKIPLREPRR